MANRQTVSLSFTHFDDGADPGRNEHEQARLLVKQIEENHDGAETSPEHWKAQHTKRHNVYYMKGLDSENP